MGARDHQSDTGQAVYGEVAQRTAVSPKASVTRPDATPSACCTTCRLPGGDRDAARACAPRRVRAGLESRPVVGRTSPNIVQLVRGVRRGGKSPAGPAITSSASPGGNTLVSTPTDTRSDKRRSDSGFFHPARGTPANYTRVRLTERYWG